MERKQSLNVQSSLPLVGDPRESGSEPPLRTGNLILSHVNARGLYTHTTELGSMLGAHGADASHGRNYQTHLGPGMGTYLCGCPFVARQDRPRHGGGVAASALQDLADCMVLLDSPAHMKEVWVLVH